MLESFTYALNLVSDVAEYSLWRAVPTNRDHTTSKIEEGKMFKIRTGQEIDEDNFIRWTLLGVGWFTFSTRQILAAKCGSGYSFTTAQR